MKGKSKGYWTKERCREESSEYKSPFKFQQGSNYVYIISWKNGWLEEFFPISERKRKSKEYWDDKERCRKVAQNCKTPTDLYKLEHLAHKISKENGWLEEFFPISERKQKHENNYWGDKERCKSESLKHENIVSFKTNVSAYKYSRLNGWLEEFFPTSERKKKPNGYWGDKEKCREAASTHTTIKGFALEFRSAYTYALSNGWLDEITSHIKPSESLKDRYIYVFEFNTNCFYVGLSWTKNRESRHLGDPKSSVFKYLKENNLNKGDYDFKILNYVNVYDASKEERKYIKRYLKNGWLKINKVRGGSIGGTKTKWTYEICKEITEKFKDTKSFKDKHMSVYHKIKREKWYDLLDHMTSSKKPNGYWSKENCKKEALKYNSLQDFRIGSNTACSVSYREGWIDEITNHIIRTQKPLGYWKSYENCKKEALKYKNISEFALKCCAGVRSSRKNGWLYEFFPKK